MTDVDRSLISCIVVLIADFSVSSYNFLATRTVGLHIVIVVQNELRVSNFVQITKVRKNIKIYEADPLPQCKVT